MIGAVLRARYELTAPLVAGPIFEAFCAIDRVNNREVTVRILKPPFERERPFVEAIAEAARRSGIVNHPAVEKLDGIDEDEGHPFLVGAYSPGITLEERIRRLAPLSVAVAVGHAISILEGLDAIHAAGQIHGDVSAKNIIISPDGSARLQLSGLWAAYSSSSTAGFVVLPAMAPYLAPEISRGAQPSTVSDVYAVGVLLYELLCGRQPYSAETATATAIKHATDPTPSIKSYTPSAPVALDEIVRKAMSKEPLTRYGTAGQMLSDLRILQDSLRFGRSLSWPFRPEDGREKSGPQPVAPRMSAARTIPSRPTGEERPPRDRSNSGDVPAWLLLAIAVAAAILIGGVGTWAFMNMSQPKLVSVPNVKGKSVEEARSTLLSFHLKLREGDHEESDQVPVDSIIRMDPDAGEKVREGFVVRVTVSSGARMIEVPDLHGLTVDAARTVLGRLNLKLKVPVVRVAASGVPKDNVFEQDPPPHQKVDKTTPISVKVSNGESGAPTDTPSAASAESTSPNGDASFDSGPALTRHIYNLKIKLTDAETAVMLRVDIDDGQGTRTLLNEPHDVGESVNVDAVGFGKTVTFRIYYDGVLKKTIQQEAPTGK